MNRLEEKNRANISYLFGTALYDTNNVVLIRSKLHFASMARNPIPYSSGVAEEDVIAQWLEWLILMRQIFRFGEKRREHKTMDKHKITALIPNWMVLRH